MTRRDEWNGIEWEVAVIRPPGGRGPRRQPGRSGHRPIRHRQENDFLPHSIRMSELKINLYTNGKNH